MIEVTKLFPAQDADIVLDEAKGNYEDVLIIGWDKEGNLDARATTTLDQYKCNYLASLFQHKLLAGDYSDNE